MTPFEHAFDRCIDAVAAHGAIVMRDKIAARASAFALEPARLDQLVDGLSRMSPQQMLETLDKEIARESATPRRWMGFGGEVPLQNLRAARRHASSLLEAGHG